ncbi:MAG: hemolysin family protein [Candidatus Diapherotrites archaeon]|nr:hemolysin family protein [Candidatus Diapherotrites archaeon]
MQNIIAQIIVLLFLIFLSGLASLTETAFVATDKIRVKKMLKKGVRNAEIVANLKKIPERVIIVLLLWNNLVNILAGSVATVFALNIFPNNFAISIATGVLTFLILVFGDIIPKRIAIKHYEIIISVMAPYVNFLVNFFGIVIDFADTISSKTIKALGIEEKEKKITQEEVKSALSLGVEEGTIKQTEKEMIHKIFLLDDIPVEEIMTPRAEIIATEENKTIKEVCEILKKKPVERIPVFKKDIDHIVGIVYTKDIIKMLAEGKNKLKINKIMEKPYFVPKTKKIDKLLREFQERKKYVAIIVDEYGTTQGIVTLDDILEEIVGSLEEGKEEGDIKKIGSKKYIVKGNVPLIEINDRFGTNFSIKEYETLAGFLINKFDSFPKEGDKIEVEDLEITIRKCDGPKIEEVIIVDKR